MATSGSESRSGLVLELAEEFLERYRNGQRPPLGEYIARHPELENEIREVFPAMAMMERIAIADESLEGDRTGDAPMIRGRLPEQLGDYRILREIGRGGMGVVYEAEQVSLGRHVALKILPSQLVGDEKTRRRFEREAKAAAKLHHTNIVPVFGVGEAGDTPYYVMQFIRGQGLDAVLEELKRIQDGAGGRVAAPNVPESPGTLDFTAADVARSLLLGEPLPEPSEPSATEPGTLARGEGSVSGSRSASSLSLPGAAPRGKSRRESYWRGIARIAHQAADALSYAHDQGIVHRDIKPSNLLLDAAGTVWIADFGLAKANDQQDLTHTGDILGTLRYMPPEAFGGKVDARGDIYSLGLTLYELLAFRPAFEEKDRGRLIRQVTGESPPPLRKRNSEIPRDLETIVQKAIERDPGHRYASAADLAEDLRRFVADEPIQARRLSAPERLARWGRRNPLIAGLTAVVGALLVAIIAGLGYANRAAESALGRETLLARQARERAGEAEGARAASETARAASEKARVEAEAAREEARAARLTLGDELYASRLNLVQTAFQAGNVARATSLLDLERPRPGEPDRRGFEWFYWQRLANPARRAWWRPGAAGFMNTGDAFSGDGRLLARVEMLERGERTAQDLFLVVREVESGAIRHRIRLEYRGSINRATAAIRISDDDARIAAVWRGDKRDVARTDLGVWELTSGKELLRRTVEQPTGGPHSSGCHIALDASGNRVAWGFRALGQDAIGMPNGADHSRMLVDEVGSGMRLLDRAVVAPEALYGLALNVHGDRLVTAIVEGKVLEASPLRSWIRVFDLPGGREWKPIDVGERLGMSMAIDAAGRRVAYARIPNTEGRRPDVQVRDLETGEVVWSRDAPVDGLVMRIDFTPDGARILVSSSSGFQVLDATADRPPLFEVHHPKNFQILGDRSVRFTRGGRTITGIVDGVVMEWVMPIPDAPLSGRAYSAAATIAISPGGELVALTEGATEGQAPAILVVEAASGRVVQRIEQQPPEALTRPSLFFSVDGSKVGLHEDVRLQLSASAMASRFHGVRVWDTRSGRPVTGLDLKALTEGEPQDLHWTASTELSGDGRRLAVAMTGYGANVGGNAVLAGESLMSGERSRIGKVIVVDVASGRIERTIRDDGRGPLNLAGVPRFSADGRLLLAVTATDSAPGVCVWDLREGGPPRVLNMPGQALPMLLAISHDARHVLGVRRSTRRWVIDRWDLARPGDQPFQIDWHGGMIEDLTLSPDGKRLAVVSGRSFQGGEVSLWDAENFRELATWAVGNRAPYEAVFTPDGRRLLVVTRDDLGRSGPSLLAFDAEPLEARIQAFSLVQRLGTDESLNQVVIEAIRAQTGYEPDVLRAAESLAAERPEDPDALLRRYNLVPRLPVPIPKARAEPWLAYTAEAARIAPGMTFAQTEHGRSLYALERYAEAKEAYAKAIALDSQTAEPYAWLALCDAQMARRAESLEAAARFLRHSRATTSSAGFKAMRDALTEGLREAFGPEIQEDLDRLANPNMPNGLEAFAH